MSKELKTATSTQLTTPTAQRQGFEVACQQEDLIVPRAKLFQGLPTEYEEYPDAKPGQILNTVTKEQLPPVFIPIKRQIEWIRFNPRDAKDPNFDKAFNPGDVIWRSTDPRDERVIAEGNWGANGEKPKATKIMSFLSLCPGMGMPVIISFMKTSYNTGKSINSVLEFNQGAMFAHKFALSSKMTKSDQYSYYVLQAKYAGKTTDEEYKQAEAIYNSFKHQVIKPDTYED